MTFLSIVFALFAEQLRAFAARDVVSAPFAKGLAWLDEESKKRRVNRVT